MDKKYIFLRDPWQYVEDDDSGWGNRIQCWEAASIIGSSLGGNHIIKVLPKEYPELSQVYFPNTEYTELSQINAIPIKDHDVERWLSNNEIDLDPNLSYITSYKFGNATNINHSFFNPRKDLVKEIKLRSETLNNLLSDFSFNTVGIHIRRGNGVHITNDDIAGIPNDYRKYYKTCLECPKEYTFIKDSTYFNIIDKIIEENPSVKFYIGIDVEEEAVGYYKTKYKDRIFTLKDFIEEHKGLLDEMKFLEPYLQLKHMGVTLLDFFALSKTLYIVHSPYSSWSYMSSRVAGKHGNKITDELQKLTDIRQHESIPRSKII